MPNRQDRPPPKEVEGRTPHQGYRPSTNTNGHQTANTDDSTASSHPAVSSDLQRRRESAVRLPGDNPDPLHRGRRIHRPATGFRAAGYKDGYAAALRWVLNAHSTDLDEMLRAKLATIIERAACQ
jgi:hypothetical protein